MKRIKLKDKLPEEGQDIFCYIPIGISKTSQEICYKKEVGIMFGDVLVVGSIDESYNGIEEYKDIEWLDETKEEITDTDRLNYLEKALKINHSTLQIHNNKYIFVTKLREFIDKQIKEYGK